MRPILRWLIVFTFPILLPGQGPSLFPSTPLPPDGSTDVLPPVVSFELNSSYGISSSFYFGTSPDPQPRIARPFTYFSEADFGSRLLPLTTYYWKVVVGGVAGAWGNSPVWSFTTPAVGPQGLGFVPVVPCRLIDTRESLGNYGKPNLFGREIRTFHFQDSNRCGIAADAQAYSINATVVPKGPLGYLTLWPGSVTQPYVSTLNAQDGRIKANAAIVPGGGADGALVNAFATNDTDLIVDVNGYFTRDAGLSFYPLPPCRVADTRNPNGPLGGPVINGGQSREFPVLSSNCGVPASAQAYSLNATVVPVTPLGYLTLWPTGQTQPYVSTLNSPTGAVVANAALVPAGTNGSISAFVTNASHLVLDINGYFAPPGQVDGSRYFPVTPCRVLDTRLPAGEFGGPVLSAGSTRSYRLPLRECSLPETATAYSLNATVVPTHSLGYLSLWPFGSAQPFVSTLNAPDDPVVANAAIVPAGTEGAVASFVTNESHLILDANGYFAPPCTFGVSQLNLNLPAEGDTTELSRTISITSTAQRCQWKTMSYSKWIAVSTMPKGIGDGGFGIQVEPNRELVQRTGYLVAGGNRLTVTQAAATCQVKVDREPGVLPASGGTSTVKVSTACDWRPNRIDRWLLISDPLEGALIPGDATITFGASPNTGPPRSGAILLGNRVYSVNQAGAQ